MSSGLVEGRMIIKRWEHCRLVAYKPLPDDKWTIGWGATGPGIHEGTVWTQEQADADLANRTSILSGQIMDLLTQFPTDGELGAMLSLTYNIGLTAFKESTLLKYFNAGEIEKAADEFLKWVHSGGHFVQGLLNRRRDERNIFLS